MEIIRFWEEEEEEYNADNPAEVEEEEEDEVCWDLRRIAWVNALRNAIIIIIMCVYEKRFL